MPDNTILEAVVTPGDELRTLEDGSGIKWPASVVCFANTLGDPDVLTVVETANPLPVDLGVNNDVQGNVAHDDPVSGNPVQLAAEARTSLRAAVANADVVRLMADLVGRLIIQPYSIADLFLQGQASPTSIASVQLFPAAGSGTRNYLTDITICNEGTSDLAVVIRDGSTEIFRIPAPQEAGAVKTFAVPLRGTANTAINVALSAGTTSDVKVSATGYKGL